MDLTPLLHAVVAMHAQHSRLLGSSREHILPRFLDSLKDLRRMSLRIITQVSEDQKSGGQALYCYCSNSGSTVLNFW